MNGPLKREEQAVLAGSSLNLRLLHTFRRVAELKSYAKNADFWGPKEGTPHLDKIEFRVLTEVAARRGAGSGRRGYRRRCAPPGA